VTADDPAPRDGSRRDSIPTAIAAAVGLGVLGPVLAVLGGQGIFLVDAAVGGLPLAVSVILTLIVGQYVAFGGLAVGYLAWRGFDRTGIVSYLGVRRPSLTEVGLVVGGWVVIVITLLVVSSVVQLLGAETASNQSAEVAMANPTIIPLFVVAMFLVVGPCEEILYRGVVQGRLRESLSAAPAIAIASGIFAFIHVMALTGGVSGRLTTVAILFFPSLVFGAVYEYTGNLVVPALLHSLHNAVIFTLLYVTVTYSDELEGMAEGGSTLAETGAALLPLLPA
jgi:membrane protease YdiL (CAAX protease family)